jgi:ABC-2 type transport system ATP-binding protein
MPLGLVRPDLHGDDRRKDLLRPPAPARAVGAALDADGFHPARTGRAHLRVYCHANQLPTRRADEVLELVGLTPAGIELAWLAERTDDLEHLFFTLTTRENTEGRN